jgi:hypothetical protein
MTTASLSKFLCTCDVCGVDFQFGPRRYEGSYIHKYQITVCSRCYSSNRDGWAPRFEPFVARNLQEQGLVLPARNAKGLLPRDG